MSGLRRNMMAASRGAGVDWESIARGMIDGVTEFSIPASMPVKATTQQFLDRTGLLEVSLDDNITQIGLGCFIGCTKLTTIRNWPSGLKVIGQNAFSGCPLEEIILPEGLTTINMYGFNKARVSRFTVPSTVTTTQNYFITGMPNLDELVMLPTTPPTLNGVNVNTWGKSTWQIYVPDASLEAYKIAKNWSDFASRMHPLSELGGGI